MSSSLVWGVLAGGAWNLASLWCLSRLLHAWLGPQHSRRRVLGWLLVKFPLLYLVAFGLLHTRAVSAMGFGIGFSVILAMAIGRFALRAKSFAAPSSHGR